MRYYFTSLLQHGTSSAWIGEALGYRGGRRTGLPFSDEYHLGIYGDLYRFRARRATVSGDMNEVTASTIWEKLIQLDSPPLLWNIFPFHPFGNDPLTNRKPLASELEMVEQITCKVLDLFDPGLILAIGRTAESQLERLGYEVTYVRHPSHGGANIFRQQMVKIYDL